MIISTPVTVGAYNDESMEEDVINEASVSADSINDLQPMSVKEADRIIEKNGYHTMSMPSSMMDQKADSMEELSTLSSLTPGVDYVDDKMMILADTYEEAVEIADCYDATLSYYQYGVGAIDLKPEETVEEILSVAASSADIPALYVDYIYSIEDFQIDESDIDESERIIKEDDIIEKENEEFSEDNQKPEAVSNDPAYSNQWQHTFTNSSDAWSITKGKGITVAVIDTGMDIDHEDLTGSRFLLAKGYNSITTRNGAAAVNDDNGHGTHVSGIIAATADNELGGSGIAPECNIVPIKVFNSSGSGSSVYTIAGVNYAISADVDVVNMSLGGVGYDKAYEKAVKTADKKGIVVVAAAGNDGTDCLHYPASYESTVCVASLEHMGYTYFLSYFSNYQDGVDIAAPGTDIYSTTYNGKYGNMSGTSMATPVVSGVVALIRASSPLLNKHTAAVSKQVKNILYNGRKDRSYYLWGSAAGYGTKTSGNFVYGGVDAFESVYEGYATGVSEIAAPTIKVDNTSTSSIVTMTAPAGNIKYVIDNGKLNADNGINYYGSFDMARSGKHTIKAIAVIGNKCSKVATYTGDFVCKTTGVVLNKGRDLPIVVGKTASLVADVYPSTAGDTSLKWTCSSTAFEINEKANTITCKEGTPAGTTATLTAMTNDGTKVTGTVRVIAITKGASKMTLDIKNQFDGKTLNMVTREATYQYNGSTVENIDLNEKNLYRVINLNEVLSTDMQEKNIIVTCKSPAVRIRESVNEDTGVVDYNLYAVNNGKAKVTITANDGSGYNFSFDVNSVTPLYDIRAVATDTGFIFSDNNNSKIYDANHGHETNETNGRVNGSQYTTFIPIARNGKIKLSTYINNDMSWRENGSGLTVIPNNKKVEYESSNASVVVKNGVVTCTKDAPVGTIVKVKVKAADGYGCYRTLTFKIFDNPGKLMVNKAMKKYFSKMSLGLGGYVSESTVLSGVYTSSKSANVYPYYAVSVPNQKSILRTKMSGNAGKAIIYAGSKKGSGTIVYKTIDGSNKKTSVRLKVATPKKLF